jgi:hypothetical protein
MIKELISNPKDFQIEYVQILPYKTSPCNLTEKRASEIDYPYPTPHDARLRAPAQSSYPQKNITISFFGPSSRFTVFQELYQVTTWYSVCNYRWLGHLCYSLADR